VRTATPLVSLGALEGVDAYLNAGGDVVASCGVSPRPAWRIGIEDPLAPGRLAGAVEVRSGAVATSGTAHRGLHITDPATGRAADAVASVTVVGPSLLWADVLATAAFVRGVVGLDLLPRDEGYEGLVVDGAGRLVRTPGFRFAGEERTIAGWRARSDDPAEPDQAWRANGLVAPDATRSAGAGRAAGAREGARARAQWRGARGRWSPASAA
jgi:hypothetical protein